MLPVLPITKPNSDVSFFYIRKSTWRDFGKHRFACVALTKEGMGYKVAWSFKHPKDRFNPSFAKQAAIGRLNSNPRFVSFDEAKDFPTFIYTLGIHEHVSQYGSKTYDLNESTFRGAKLELEPKRPQTKELK